MEDKFIIVGLENWEGLYHKGKLIEQGHEIRREVLVRLMKQHTIWDVDFEYLNHEGEQTVLNTGWMFDTYEEAKKYIE